MEVAKVVYQCTQAFPTHEQFGLTAQIRRSTVSVASNIAEGAGRNSKGEFRQFLGIATGSAFELETQLILAKDLGYVKDEAFDQLQIGLSDILKMIRSLQTHLAKPTKD